LFNFFKKEKNAHKFTPIKNFHRKNYYFVRKADWGWLDEEHIFIKDHKRSNVRTLASWGLDIFVSANGDKTVEEFVYFVAALYEEGVPEGLEQTIIFELVRLADLNLIALAREKQMPTQAFNSPGLMPG
jgi:hypothetical protein